jgi:hypothetical protein
MIAELLGLKDKKAEIAKSKYGNWAGQLWVSSNAALRLAIGFFAVAVALGLLYILLPYFLYVIFGGSPLTCNGNDTGIMNILCNLAPLVMMLCFMGSFLIILFYVLIVCDLAFSMKESIFGIIIIIIPLITLILSFFTNQFICGSGIFISLILALLYKYMKSQELKA